MDSINNGEWSQEMNEKFALIKYQHDLDWQRDSFNATIGFAVAGLKALILVNGAAAVSLSTFMGELAPKDRAAINAAYF